jgi:tRNA G18 (ribose-2'-O)-methylase SpoU
VTSHWQAGDRRLAACLTDYDAPLTRRIAWHAAQDRKNPNHRGAVLLCSELALPSVSADDARWASAPDAAAGADAEAAQHSAAPPQILLVLDQISDPHNL